MDWQEYAETGMVHHDAAMDRVTAGVIKPTYRIQDSDSRSYILQTVRTGEGERLQIQQQVYERLRGTDVPVPETVHDASRETVPYTVTRNSGTKDLDSGYSDRDTGELQELAHDAARYLGLAHREFSYDGAGELQPGEEGVETAWEIPWDQYFSGYMDNMMGLLRDSPFDDGRLLDDIEEAVDQTIDDLPTDPDCRIMHRDYRPGNMRGEDGQITAVLDWDNAVSGDPYYDYVRAEHAFADRFDSEEKRETVRDAFREGYRSVAADLMDDSRYQHYRFGATVDKAACLVYGIDEEELEDHHLVDVFKEALGREMDRLYDGE